MSVSMKLKDRMPIPANLHFSRAWGNLSTKTEEEKYYKIVVENFICLAVIATNSLYPTRVRNGRRESREITVVPDNQMRVMYGPDHRLHIAKLENFKKTVIINGEPMIEFNYRNPIHLYNLYTNICHEIGHIINNDGKYPFIKLPNEVKLLVSLKETRADIFAKKLMTRFNYPYYFDWFDEKAINGYFDKETRKSLVEGATVYNMTIINKIIRLRQDSYGKNIRKKTINYLTNKYSNRALEHFEDLLGVPLRSQV